MTYTFKLARRLAVSRRLVVLTALALVAACTGDATAPEANPSTSPLAGSFKVIGRGHGWKGSPAGALASVTVSPTSVSLTPGATHQFQAYGRDSLGDSVTVAVAFDATGGTITTGGLYTAGQTGGTYRVTASASGLADTAAVNLSPPVASPVTSPVTSWATGIPFGPFGLVAAGITSPDMQVFTLGQDSYAASNILTRISAARTAGIHLMVALTGGDHANYLTNGVFDPSKWGAKLDTYNTAAIRDAIAGGVADGTIVGASVMDEPNVCGGGDGNTWGPCGTMTKVRVDSLCGAMKRMFTSLPVGVQHRWDVFEPTRSYRVCDYLNTQYSTRIGSVTAYRDGALAMGARDHHAIVFSINLLNGGAQDLDGTWDCTGTGQAGLGTYGPNCRMTAAQVKGYGLILGPAGCALTAWRADDVFMARSDNQAAFKALADSLAKLPRTQCRRS